VTIEGLERNGKLHPLQQAFMQHDGLQCGFCTPGMIVAGVSFLTANPQPTRDQVVRGLEPHICRCGAHTRIIRAVLTAGRGNERWKIT